MFLVHIPSGAKILDAGCGSARNAAFHDMGYQVRAFYASQALVDIANTMLPFDVQSATFESFTSPSDFGGLVDPEVMGSTWTKQVTFWLPVN